MADVLGEKDEGQPLRQLPASAPASSYASAPGSEVSQHVNKHRADMMMLFHNQRAQSEEKFGNWLGQLESLATQLESQRRDQLDEHELLLARAMSSDAHSTGTMVPAAAVAAERLAASARSWPQSVAAQAPPKADEDRRPMTEGSAAEVSFGQALAVVPGSQGGGREHTPRNRTPSTPTVAWPEPRVATPASPTSPSKADRLAEERRKSAKRFKDDQDEVVRMESVKRFATKKHRMFLYFNGMMPVWEVPPALKRLLQGWRIELLFTTMESTWYQVFCSTIIVFNAVFVGVRAEIQLRQDFSRIRGEPIGDQDSWGAVVDRLFCAWFFSELLVSFFADPRFFFTGTNKKWNAFDFVLVLTCLVESTVEGAVDRLGEYMRVLRIFRTARVLRIIRVFKVFTSLRLMVYAIVQSVFAQLWVFSLLLLLMYVFAIFFLNAAAEYASRPRSEIDLVEVAELEAYYGTMFDCLYTLFMAISGGKDWEDLMRPLASVSRFYKVMYIFYIFFVVFGVLNVVTGAFVDSFAVVSQRDRDVVIEDEMRRERKYMVEIKNIFSGADTDGSGKLTLEEFESHLRDGRVKAFLQTLHLDSSQARALFMLLDTDDTNEVSIDEFVSGCSRLKGDAKSIDVNMLLYETEYMIGRFTAGLNRIETKLGCDTEDLALDRLSIGRQARQAVGHTVPPAQTDVF